MMREELIGRQYDNYSGIMTEKQEVASYILREGRPIITDSLISEPWINQTIAQAFYLPELFTKHRHKLRKRQNFFEFVLGRLASRHKNLEFLWGKKKEMQDLVY